MMKKEGKKGEYDVVLVPECECEGTFILKAESCPTCDAALEELLACAEAEAEELVEIPAECLKEVGVTVEYLIECGFIKVEEEEEEKKPVAKKYFAAEEEEEEEEEETEVVIVKKEKEPEPAPISAIASASASAEAVASGDGASASASASASAGL